MRSHSARRSGFTMVELAALVVIMALIAAALLLSSSRSRRMGELGQDLAHLREMGTLTGAYGADNGDRFWTFSWRAGHNYTTDPALNNAPTDLQAAANQCVYLLRTRAGQTNMPVLNATIVHFFFSHLVLADYAGQKFPWPLMISAGDSYRARWANDPNCFNTGCFLPYQPYPFDFTQRRWPFSSSFAPVPALIDQSTVGNRLENAGADNLYNTTVSTALGGQPLSMIAFPSQKVMNHDQNARFFGPRQAYCTHDEARLPLLLGDASVAVKAASESNPGWSPNSPASPQPSVYTYNPTDRLWNPPALNPGGDQVQGRFRYTRGGLLGRDFGGPEVY